MSKLTIGVIFGSRSAEHDVSIVTAISSIMTPLELTKRYNVVPIYIDKKGRWFSDDKFKDVHFFSSKGVNDYLAKAKPVAIQFNNGLQIVKPGLKNQVTQIDIGFPATHGTHGEDGELMAIFELAGIPFVGCGVAASVLAMDKVLAKLVAQANDVPTPKFESFSKDDFGANTDQWLDTIEKQLRYPLFVKPSHLGSSIGITQVKSRTELQNAIEVALHYDSKALVEEGVANLREVTLPIMGNETPVPALLEEPIVHDEAFFDFDTKYLGQGKGGKKMGGEQGAQGYSKLPADLPTDIALKATEIAVRMYQALGCEGIARIDLLINSSTKTVYFNEANPLPGSLYAHNWRAAGVSGVELVTRLVDLAVARHTRQKSIETVFDTNFLQQF